MVLTADVHCGEQPLCWLDSGGDSSKSWVRILQEEVMHADMVDYFTAQRDLRWVPLPCPGIKKLQDRVRIGIFMYPICVEYGTRWAIPTSVHSIT